MRVSTSFLQSQGVQSILDQQSVLSKLQDQLSTGKKILVPSDDPSAASRITNLDEAIKEIGQFNENATFAEQRLGLEEATLTSVENILQRVRELTLQAANTISQSPETRFAIAEELDQKLNEIFDYANSKDINGEFLFSGFQSGTQTFTTDGAGNFTYNGDQGNLSMQIGRNRTVVANDNGADVFQLIRTGNGTFSVDNNAANTGSGIIATGSVQNPAVYQAQDFTIRFTGPATYEVDNNTTGAVNIIGAQAFTEGAAITFNGIETNITGTPQTGDSFTVTASRHKDIFSTLYDLSNTVSNTPNTVAGDAQYSQALKNALNDIDRAMGNVLTAHTSIGGRLTSIESQADNNSAKELQLQTVLSDIRDLDYAEAISKMTIQTTALQVAQQTFVKVQGLSLFNFI